MRFKKNNISWVFIFASFFYCLQSLAQSQSTAPYIPSVISPSPNASTLLKFTDVPVSPYTGTADVTVPIYTIQAKGLTVPVSLSYHTGGIRLKEEAGLVGLGWALNAGGAISRTIMDHDDFGSQGIPYFTNAVPQLAADLTTNHPDPPTDPVNLGIYFYDFFCTYLVGTTAGNENFYNAFTAGVAQYDMEPDIFSYNFPGHSGKFIITRAGKVVMQKQENINIQFQSGGQSFTITDDQGNKFFFNDQELTQTVGAAQPVSSWYLSKIITEQHDSVMFTYTGGGQTSIQADINQTYNAYCANNSGSFSSQAGPTLYFGKILQTINFSNGQLQFVFDNKRSDLSAGNKLDSIIVFSKNAAGSLTYVKQHDFYYSYFYKSFPYGTDSLEFNRLRLDSVKEASGSFKLPAYSFLYNNNTSASSMTAKHGYSVDHWGYFNGAANSTFIPSINCFFNPPGAMLIYPDYFTYSGANREPSLDYLQNFSLQQVTYPTGGKTVLNYQANDYDFNLSSNGPTDFEYVNVVPIDSIINVTHHGTTSGSFDLSHIYPLLPIGSIESNLTLNIAFKYQVSNQFSYQNTSGKIYFTFTGPNVNITQDINGTSCAPGTPVCSVSIPVTISSYGVYNWTAYIDPTIDTVAVFSEIHPEVEYQETQSDFNLYNNASYVSPASGLRIQSIINYKDPVTIADEKTFTYGYLQDKLGTGSPQQYSYGRLMSFPSYVRYATTTTNLGGYCNSLSLFSSSNNALTSVIQGNIVGYDQVTESSIDPVTGLDIGKTVYSYYNSPDTPVSYSGFKFPGTLNMGYNLNGLLKSKVIYADNGNVYTKVSETDNYYHPTNRIVYFSPKYIYVYPRAALAPWLCTADTAVESETNACFYPSIKSERILLDSTVNINYQQGDITKSVTSKNYYFYDNPLHYQLTRSGTIDSRGDTLITKIKYPQDYIPTGFTVTGNTILDSMIGRNMVSETIEKQDSLYYSGSSSGYITGAQLSLFRILSANANTIIPDKIYKLDIQSPVTNFQPFSISGNTTTLDSRNRQMISFDQYDGNNNIQQYTPTDQNSVSILWDYTHVYPIAQVKNAALSDVAATSFEADGSGNWTIGSVLRDSVTAAITGTKSFNLTNGTVSKTGLTSGTTYIVSYWSKTGSSYTVTGSTAVKQGKTINGWTYFEHTVSGTTSVTISGGGDIDELRLYPSTAQMTTYTYSPLAGMTTSCDVDNKINYYFYDNYQRLKMIKDQDGNIIKTMQYHYANQNPFNQ